MLFDAVLFDLDGTLVATDRFWIPAARVGARRAFAELGLKLEPPSADDWMSIVGHPFENGLRSLFPELSEPDRATIGRECMKEEERRLASGGAAPMPGALDLLRDLRQAGVRIGVASNCAGSYLDHMLGRLGLGEFVEEARCLDSKGIANKADMIADLMLTFGTRSAVFVGDRVSDRDAAWANGLPHVHCRFGFAPVGEDTLAEGMIEDLGALPALLAARQRWIESALEKAGCLRALSTSSTPLAIGVTGLPGAGKTLFARDAGRVFSGHGVPALAASLERVRRPLPGPPPDADGDHLNHAYDLRRLEEELLEPLRRGELIADGEGDEPADVLLLDGPFLLDPRLRPRLDRVLQLEIPEELSLRRTSGRTLSGGDPEPLITLHRQDLPAQRSFQARYPAAEHADLVLDASNPLGVDPAAISG